MVTVPGSLNFIEKMRLFVTPITSRSLRMSYFIREKLPGQYGR